MNILIVTPQYHNKNPLHVGGPQIVERVAVELAKQYVRVNTLSEIHIFFFLKLWNLLKAVDIVYLSPVYNWRIPVTLLFAKMQNKPVVLSPHGSLQRWHGTTKRFVKYIWENMCCLLLPPSFMLHVTSEQEEKESKKVFPRADSVIIPNGVDIPPILHNRKKCTPDDSLILLYIGRIDPKKGIENLLFACTLLHRNTYKLIIAGSGKKRHTMYIERLIQTLGLSKNVSMIGHVTGKKREQVWGVTDVTIIPSYTENFCSVVAESLAREVPVIASKYTPWQEVETQKCGKWVSNTPESLAQAIEEIKKEELDEMGQRGRTWMKKDFSWDKQAKALVTALSTFSNLTQRDIIREKA